MNTLSSMGITALCYGLLFIGSMGCRPATDDPTSQDSMVLAEAEEKADAIDFVLPTITGDSLQLADYRGKVVLLNFWATWCAPCRVEIPDLIDLHEKLGPDDFVVIGISLDETDSDLVQEFAAEMRINYPIALDRSGAFAELFGGVYALPTTYVLDRKGDIVHRTIGLFPTDTMKEELTALMDEG